MKSEIKVEFTHKKVLKDLIQKSYFKDGQKGKLAGQKNYIEVTPEFDDVLHTIIKGLNNITIKVINPEIIDGSFRFIISEEKDTIKIYPISTFCILEEERYSFY